ncbi:cytidylyltransferase domain-containing protein [Lysinibacillus capsici]|uniref:acylneuraminate cytidylyltransferase family protein n=1 Tax=Lysinibacillus capsici TaxID=2115968 RepID=UPI0039FD5D50
MFKEKSILVVVPARGGSKGVPRKNIRLLAGKPLIEWTFQAAVKSKYIDRIVLSSEDDEIIEVAKSVGYDVPFKRPHELALDDTHGIEPILHAIKECEGFDYVMMLQPTSPLRTVEDIDKFIEQFFEKKAKSSVSVCEPSKSPYWMYEVEENGGLKPLLPEFALVPRRQALPTVYSLNGALYMAEVSWLQQTRNFMSEETISYIMPQERSYDIDTMLDFCICEFLLNRKDLNI